MTYTSTPSPVPLYAPVHILDDPPSHTQSFPQLRTNLMDGLFLNQKTNKNIISLNIVFTEI